ncbi:MAG: hypothetical protein GYA61_08305 [Spirochaetales bacterium]|jgi:hypothetical protein|nr:hypothetical protein [Exilispira sp.]NMC68211.1 hypothetical protein [Spirochaetales bacterium]
MEEVIKSIIESIPSGYVFDTHAIIEYLLQNNSDIYLSSYNGNSTELYHGDIGRLIAEFENTIIERVGDSWSLNIHKRFSKCACWRKL